MDIDLDDVKDYENDECIFDADYFETPQEYEDYINGLIGKKKKYQGRKQQRIICIGL